VLTIQAFFWLCKAISSTFESETKRQTPSQVVLPQPHQRYNHLNTQHTLNTITIRKDFWLFCKNNNNPNMQTSASAGRLVLAFAVVTALLATTVTAKCPCGCAVSALGRCQVCNICKEDVPTSIPGVINAVQGAVTGGLPEQKCGSCGCLIRDNNGRCVTCKPKEQCQLANTFKCSCPTGHTTNKWDKQHALERRFCAGKRCSPTGCCGGVRYGRQEGGTEALNFATQTALACAACTYGCGACAGAMAQRLIIEEMNLQVRFFVVVLASSLSLSISLSVCLWYFAGPPTHQALGTNTSSDRTKSTDSQHFAGSSKCIRGSRQCSVAVGRRAVHAAVKRGANYCERHCTDWKDQSRRRGRSARCRLWSVHL
jgi:hypothetical protein